MTPLSSLVSAAGLTWDFVGFWPILEPTDVNFLNGWALPGGRYALGVGRGVDSNQTALIDMCITNAAMGGDRQIESMGGAPYTRLWSAAAGYSLLGLDAFSAMLETGQGFDLAAGAEWSTVRRAYWLKFLIQSATAAPDLRNGLLLMPRYGVQHAWPGQPLGINNSGGFGIIGDGAGQWQYGSYDRTGPYAVLENVALPAHVLTEWNQVDIVIISERAGLPAEMQFWFNGALQLTRNWVGVDLVAPVPGEWRWTPMMSGGSIPAGGGESKFHSVECRMGRYDSQGVAV